MLAWGAASDIKSRILPNWLAALLLVFGLAFAFTSGGLEALGWHAAHSATALLVGMMLFAVGFVGAGDAKFYAGLAAFFPLSLGLELIFLVAVAGGILALCWLIARKFAGKNNGAPKGNHAKLPYGVAIAAGGTVLAWTGSITA